MEKEESKTEQEEKEKKPSKADRKLEKHVVEKLRGRVVIINPEESEFAKHLNLHKKGDYNQKK